jgi:hypothetical protein
MKFPISLGWLLVLLVLAASESSAQREEQYFQGAQAEEFLTRAEIPTLSRGSVPSKVTAELNGLKLAAFWTPWVLHVERGDDVDLLNGWRKEITAYEIDKLTGLNMVPAAVERNFGGLTGSLQLRPDSKMSEAERLQKKIGPPGGELWDQLMSKVRLYDYLLCNRGRSERSILITEDSQLRLIDNSRALPRTCNLNSLTMPRHFSKALLAGMEALNESILNERVGKHVNAFQIYDLLQRKNRILEAARKRVAEGDEAFTLYP